LFRPAEDFKLRAQRFATPSFSGVSSRHPQLICLQLIIYGSSAIHYLTERRSSLCMTVFSLAEQIHQARVTVRDANISTCARRKIRNSRGFITVIVPFLITVTNRRRISEMFSFLCSTEFATYIATYKNSYSVALFFQTCSWARPIFLPVERNGRNMKLHFL